MANIQNQIDEISTAFYGSQVRGAIVEGLQSINDEVNSLNTNITEVDSKTEKMDAIVNTSTEKIQELIGEYNNINTEAQEKFKQIDGALSNVLVDSQFTNPTINGGEIKNSNLSNITLTDDMNINGDLIIGSKLGEIIFQNSNNENMLGLNPFNDTYQVKNLITNNNIYSVTPVNSGTDTMNIEANINVTNPIKIQASSALHFISSEEQAYNLAIGYDPGNNTFSVFNENTWAELMSLDANTLNTLNINITPNLDKGIQAFGNNVIQYNKLPYSVIISPGITATGTVEFFLINAPQLGGENITGSIGIVTVTTTLDEWYTWPKDNNIVVDITGIPNATARTISPFNNLNIGIDGGQLYMSGVGTALNNGQTYTNQALLWQ